MDGQVRTWEEFEQARSTHFLESTDRQTSQDIEGIQASDEHTPTEEHKWMNKSGHGKNLSE